MGRLITELKGDELALAMFSADAHPVTDVDCDENGMLFFERDGASRLWLSASTPHESRRVFLRHVIAACEEFDESPHDPKDMVYWRKPMSSTGRGLSRWELRVRTAVAVKKSNLMEQRRRDAFNAKYSSEKVLGMLEKLKVTAEDIERINAESPVANTGFEYRITNLGERDGQGTSSIELAHRL